ncbi:MAG: DegT/DnrJ/EryC1/StrS family aminotransferase [Gammaproteobacteria bacterium]|nr:DegT/DnrJ/EryC1/StrS family aminotransferase [Gammaproteobacteria bacterium]
MKKLALLGGIPFIHQEFRRHNFIGEEERVAVDSVLKSGVLSQFLGAWHEDFYGGPKVRQFEGDWASYFNVNHAVSVNSNTSGLIAALGAIELEPGDEVIVSPWSMSASATSILVWNAIPIFADIESDTYNLDIKSIEACITEKTKAIMVPDIFGHAANLNAIMQLAKKHNLKVIEDAAQAPGALYHGKKVGTIADIGVFSLNYHKHIHSGEGGVCVTNDAKLCERMQLIRNHAESVVAGKKVENISNMIGFNFRMTEIEAAIGIEQLKKLDNIITAKQAQGDYLIKALSGLPHLKLPIIKSECTHIFYIFSMTIDIEKIGISSGTIVKALQAEGVPGLSTGYVNIHLMPMYQKKIAYGSNGFPWSADFVRKGIQYTRGICPVAENLHQNTFIKMVLCLYDFSFEDLDAIAKAFCKVWSEMDELRVWEEKNASSDCIA